MGCTDKKYRSFKKGAPTPSSSLLQTLSTIMFNTFQQDYLPLPIVQLVSSLFDVLYSADPIIVVRFGCSVCQPRPLRRHHGLGGGRRTTV